MEARATDFRDVPGRDLLMSLRRLGEAIGLGIHGPGLETDSDEHEYHPDFSGEESDGIEEDLTEDGPSHNAVLRPPPCSFLYPGRSFAGQQRVSGPTHRVQEDWAVTVTIYSCDFSLGRITGSMVAQNNPQAKRPIITYFEGDIIDNVNHSFYTGAKWGVSISPETDLRYWSRCVGFGTGLKRAVESHNGRPPQLGGCKHVFMRWKECFFVDAPQDCPLTITGFYYLSIDRSCGSLAGFYHDMRSAPLQVLQLRPAELGDPGGSGSAGLRPSNSIALVGAARRHSTPGNVAEGVAAASPELASGELPSGLAFGSYALC